MQVPFTAASMISASSAAEARASEAVLQQDAVAAAIELQRANLYASWAIVAELQTRVDR